MIWGMSAGACLTWRSSTVEDEDKQKAFQFVRTLIRSQQRLFALTLGLSLFAGLVDNIMDELFRNNGYIEAQRLSCYQEVCL